MYHENGLSTFFVCQKGIDVLVVQSCKKCNFFIQKRNK
jgi:hypothetical protein